MTKYPWDLSRILHHHGGCMDSLGSAEDMVDSPGAAVAEVSIGNVMKCVEH